MSGKVALVTGSSRGIGRAIALRLAADGCQVVVNYRAGADAAAEVVGSIEAAGGTAIAVQGDVTDAAAVESLIGQTLERFGRLDVLVNNAGVTRDGLLMRMKDEDWDMVIATNLRSVFLASRAVLRPMMRQRGGRIVSITSISGLSGNAGQCNYACLLYTSRCV